MNVKEGLHRVVLLGTFCAFTAGSLFLCGAAAYAETGTDIYQAVDGNRISEERLMDQTVEYDELGSLIHTYNVDVQNVESGTENKKQQYTKIKDYLSGEKFSANRNREEAKEEGDMVSYTEYTTCKVIYKNALESYNKMLDQLEEYPANKNRITLEKQLTSAAQSLMISYDSLKLQKEYLTKMEDLMRRLYENTAMRQQAGLATEQEVLIARYDWNSALISLESLESNEDTVYRSLCILLGIDDEGNIEFRNMPETDLQSIAEISLERDTGKAIGNNLDIIEERHTSSVTTSKVDRKSRTLQELEDRVSVKMKELYDAVQQAQIAYDAAYTGYLSAEITWENAKNKYSMKMLDEAEYLQEELAYIRKKTGFESADLELFQALQTYQWAVNGIVTLD